MLAALLGGCVQSTKTATATGFVAGAVEGEFYFVGTVATSHIDWEKGINELHSSAYWFRCQDRSVDGIPETVCRQIADYGAIEAAMLDGSPLVFPQSDRLIPVQSAVPEAGPALEVKAAQ